MSAFHLAELCCGSAALTLHYLGAKRQVVPYQGSKWRVRRELASFLAERGHDELGASTLCDVGPWGVVWSSLRHPNQVVDELRRLDSEDPRVVFDRLHGGMVPYEGPKYAAQYLFLQRLSYSGKAVGYRREESWRKRWVSPGFCVTSAYGTPATEKFGAIRPMIRSLIEVLESMQSLRWPGYSTTCSCDARDADVYPAGLPRVVYIDPNYVGSTGYPCGGLSRAEVVSLAHRWAAQCDMTVMVSEAEPIVELTGCGWEGRCLRGLTTDGKPFQSKAPEWVTVWPPAR